jgi:RTX calcium-binding nonapeptide repeat (4 copies)
MRTRLLLAALAVALALPGSVQAGTVSLEAGSIRFADPAGANDELTSTLRFDPDGGVDPLGWSVSFLEFDPPLVTGPGCEVGFVSASRFCSSGGAPPATLRIDLGAGDDAVELVNEQPTAPTTLSILGGTGPDVISTYQARALLDGGDGDDLIRPDDRPTALSVPPEPSPRGVVRGGAGIDTVDYAGGFSRIDVSLDGEANDGRPGERDDVASDVENVQGGDFGGRLLGSKRANRLSGGGADDRITGAAGRDALAGAGGNDVLDALDGAGRDSVDCGSGVDTAQLDSGDALAAGCERVAWAPRVASARLRSANGAIAVALSCPRASAGACRGTLRLTFVRAGKPVTLAKARYRVRRGGRTSVSAKTTRAGRAALSRKRRVRARLLVAPAGSRPTAGRAVTVRN